MDIRKTFFTKMGARHWHRLPREMVEPPSLEMLKKHMDGMLRDIV